MGSEYGIFKQRAVIPLFSAALLLLQSCYSDDLLTSRVGCFKLGSYDMFHAVKQPHAADSVPSCINACKEEYFRYAGLYNAVDCLCGTNHGTRVSGECNLPCSQEPTQLCGGRDSVDIYDTGLRVPGPPSSMKVQNITTTSVLLTWGPPKVYDGVITQYVISAVYLKTFARTPLNSPMEWNYSNTSLRADLFGFHPGTQYNISVQAKSEEGDGAIISQLFWTVIGDPDVPDVPKIIKREKDRMIIKIEPVENNNGPVSSYRVVVIDGSSPVSFDTANLESWSRAHCVQQNDSENCIDQDGIPYYIAAELTAEQIAANFIVGDGLTYGTYYNSPLQEGADVRVIVGVVSTMDGVSKVSYSSPTNGGSQRRTPSPSEDTMEEPDSGIIVGLSIAIGVFGFFLVLSIVGYFMLKKKLERRRGTYDHQELSLHGPMAEVETSGYIHDAYIVEDEGPVNYYDNLKKKVWSIPKNFLEVKSDVIGQGKYGSVVKGTVKQRGTPVPVSVHYVMDEYNRHPSDRVMLEDFDKIIRTNPHTNVVALIGTSEIPEALLVVLEYHPATLKDILLESRILDHVASNHSRDQICSLQEGYLLEVAVGVANGMDHLAQKKVHHGKLCARNVLMADGLTPKISFFGIADYVKNSMVPDYARWTAQEMFRSKHHVPKSDVWSFGCLLWEIVTFGGTPYMDVPSRDVPSRVIRGLRPYRPSYVGDDLYQLMLQCWQIDLDERPNFFEASKILENMLEESEVHLNFSIYSGFHYEPYIPELENTK